MEEIKRITPADARREVMSGKALFVCGYESEELCSRMQLEGSISLGQFRERLPLLEKSQEIIFFCT